MAQIVFTGGRVWTGAPGDGNDATALAVEGGRILAVGADQEILGRAAPGARAVDLRGRAVLPGFIDAHTHFLAGGFQLSRVDLRDAATPEEFAERIVHFAGTVPEGTWILGGSWDHERWGGELPRREWIDELTPSHPVLVHRLDLHMALANSLALERAGLDRDGRTPDPVGGAIVRDPATGRALGVLKDAAIELVAVAMPEPTEAELDDALQAAAHHALSLGVTQVHDMGTWDNLATYRRARDAGRLPVRVYSVVPMSTWERLRELIAREGRGDERLWWGGLKAFMDGSLGSTTAWFHEPYRDAPSNYGLTTADAARIRRWVRDLDAAGLQPIVHAIGDRANDELLDAYADVIEENAHRERRFRIEHAQHLSPGAFRRFRDLGVIASMQPYHAADDGRWAEKRVGAERARGMYAFRSLLDAGATVAFGSDWTVAPLDPVPGIDAAVTRRTLDGGHPDGWEPQERISLEETLRAYTDAAARAGFSEAFTGTLEPGKAADLVVLDCDPFVLDPKSLINVRVDMTVLDGDVVFERHVPE